MPLAGRKSGVVAAKRDNAALPTTKPARASGPSPRRDQPPLPRITTLMSWLDAAVISTRPILRPVKKGNRPPPLHGL